MSFKEKFPGLHKEDDCYRDLDSMPDITWWNQKSIEKHCLDKQRVREAIQKMSKYIEQAEGAYGEELKNLMYKELGL